ncbi:MAG: hypothetical protein EHM79_04195 [Geobacter sp.]|nr:MAG: hypothetical protein EHM79_04195 [Geobacter sp.]
MTNETCALFSEIAFWGWVFSCAGFTFYSFPSRGIFVKKSAVAWGGIFLLCYAVWGFTMVCF